MKRIVSFILVLALCLGMCLAFASCGGTDIKVNPDKEHYVVGICQLMRHAALDQATEGFKAGLEKALEAAGRTVEFDTQVPGDATLCPTVITSFTAKDVDLIMANATPALLSAANATANIPILGTSVTDYNDTFNNQIPANVSGTSDAVPFDEQAQMMIDTLGLKSGDKVGVIYCSSETNSALQYNAVEELFTSKGISVSAYTFSETTELQAVATAAATECKAIYVPSDNTVSQNESIVAAAADEANTPVYTSYGGEICYASLSIDYYQLGYKTGEMAAKVLLGQQSVTDMEIVTLTPAVSYNEELCEKLGIQVPKSE